MQAIPSHPSDPGSDTSRPYLRACPGCQSSNGANATACWNCERPFPLHGPFEDEDEAPSVDEATDAAQAPPSFFPVLREELDAGAANDSATWDSLWPLVPSPHAEPPGVTPAVAAPPARRVRWRILAGASGAALIGLLVLAGSFLAGRPAPVPGPGATALAPAVPAAPAVLAAPAVPIVPIAPIDARPSAGTGPAPPQGSTTAVLGFDDARARAAPPAPPERAAAQALPPARADEVRPMRRAVARAAPANAAAATPARNERPALPPVPAPCTPNVAALGLCVLPAP